MNWIKNLKNKEHFIQTNNLQESIEKSKNSCLKHLIQ